LADLSVVDVETIIYKSLTHGNGQLEGFFLQNCQVLNVSPKVRGGIKKHFDIQMQAECRHRNA